MNFTLHQLTVFLKVAEKSSITKAAEELHLTQPAVSIQMKKLQEQFDTPLVEVIGRQLYVTDFGSEIAKICRRILHEVDDIKYKSQAYQGRLIGQLKISVASTAKYVIPYFLSGFLHQHPGVDLLLDVTNKTRVVESLEKNDIDLAMVSVLPAHLQVDRMELMENQLYLVSRSPTHGNMDYPLPENIPYIYREPGSATRKAMETFLDTNRDPQRKAMELTSNEAVKQAVIAGLGQSIMPLIGIKEELKRGVLKIIPTKGLPIVTHWNLVWLRGKSFTPIAQACLDYIAKNKERIIRENFESL